MEFVKMQALGNDFVVVHAGPRPPPAPEWVRRLAQRRTGIGFDQLLWLEPPRASGAQVYYRVFNADGGEVEQCGNGARCVARLVAGATPGAELVLEHGGGLARARIEPDGQVSVDMGAPDFRPESLPFVAAREASEYALDVDGETVVVGVVSMGNPHAVLLVDDVDTAPVERLGALLERHACFPRRANIGFAQVVARNALRLRVFERGVGETRACGTGACAAAVIGRRAGLLDSTVRVALPGGELTVHWEGPGAPVWLTGEALTVFRGTVDP